ncbi:MAG: tRNA lysidine(34) synthetase TilS [Rhodobacterales bacterium]|nr:tRNA lysidine(34) synthetase TilS [Rhodobacterales bacterium]
MGVAVSGGSDSMALLHLAARVARQVGWSLRAVTVDHRLRPEAVEEAAHVARVCNDLGVPHDVVVWEHGDISGNLMEAARLARYHLMSEWGKTHGVGSVLLGHTADDEAETFLMALSRAAGLEGLSGMRRSFVEGSVTFRRPLLHEPRAALRAYLVRHGLTWVDDPTNENDRYTRTKARRALKALKPLGISVERLSSVVHNLHMAQGVVAEAVRKAGQEVVTETAGSLVFDRKEFLLLGPEINRLLLHAMLGWMTGQRHPPRSDQVRNLHFAVVKERDATLAGCRFLHRDGRVIMTREARAVGGPVPVGEVWDGRWQVSGPAGEVRALGADGLRQRPDWRSVGLPREALAATPAVWQGETLVSAPLAGWENGWSARLDAPVRFFGLSD